MRCTATVAVGLATAVVAGAGSSSAGAAVPPGAPVQLAPPNACYTTTAAGGCSAFGDGQSIDGAEPVALSGDGTDLYAGGENGGGVAFARSAAGPLSAIGPAGGFADTSFALNAGALIAGFRDSGIDNGEVDAYSRASGVPSFVDKVTDSCPTGTPHCANNNGLYDVEGVAVAASGTRVYAASHYGGGGAPGGALTAFLLNSHTDAIGEIQCVAQTPSSSGLCSGGSGTQGLGGADSIALTPDGKFLYATGYFDGSVLGFNLSPGQAGGLIVNVVNCLWSQATSTCANAPGLEGASGLALSPDGRDLYVAAFNRGIAALHRDPLSGVLSFGQCYTQTGGAGCAADPALVVGGRDVVVSPDGRFVYLVGGSMTDGVLRTYARDPATGDLTPLACVSYLADPGCSTAAGLLNADELAIAPDGTSLYVTSFAGGDGDGAVAAFRIQQGPPVISAARLSHRRFRVGRRATVISAKKTPRGTTFSFTLSQPALLRIAITRSAAGLRRGHRCVAPTAKLRRAHAKSCRRSITAGTLTRAHESAGRDSVAFSGRIGHRPLSPQKYRAILTASNAGGSSKPVTLSFSVVSRGRG